MKSERLWALAALRKNVMYDMAMNVGQSKISSLKPVRQSFVIDSQQMHDRGLEVVHVNRILCNVKANRIGFAIA